MRTETVAGQSAAVAAAAPRDETLGDIIARYDPYLCECRDRIVSGLADAPVGPLLMEHFARGKLLRALLVFLAAAAVGTDPSRVMTAAEALELLHGAALIHDDIIDEAPRRRGSPALHARVGANAALVLGDYLLTRAFAALCAARDTHPMARVLEAAHALSGYAQECCRGQVEELLPSAHSDPEAAYLSMISGKTGAQFAAAAALGAILGDGTPEEVAALHTYGLNVGVAFQIRDDILDLFGDPDALGKPTGKSLAQGRLMLPLIYLRRHESPVRTAGHPYAPPPEDRERWTAAGLPERLRVAAEVEATGERYAAIALGALSPLRPRDEVGALRSLAAYVTRRQI